ncbi:MAG TPA: SOS response-associated peptidase family protein [Saprospiraceae bacterium]|nr:SOS response-associated peptidase family protein [Saprospiraceae bacterium]
MLNLYTIATKPPVLAEQLHHNVLEEYTPAYQARPGMALPVILCSESKPVIVIARWGCTTEAATMSLNSFPMDRILTQPPFNRWLHTQRCLIPANCFFARRTDTDLRPDEHNIYLIRILQSRLFLIGGLFTVEHRRNSKDIYSFLLLTTESADVLRPLTDQMPVILSIEHLSTWLTSDHLIDVMHLADRSGDRWFDYFPVNSKILTPGMNDRDLLKPLGLSLQEMTEREHKLKAIDIRQDRFDRKGGKW